MTKEELILLLNRNECNISQYEGNIIIVDYLTNKGIEHNRIQQFLVELVNNPKYLITNSYKRCVIYIVKELQRKFNINSIEYNNKAILFY